MKGIIDIVIAGVTLCTILVLSYQPAAAEEISSYVEALIEDVEPAKRKCCVCSYDSQPSCSVNPDGSCSTDCARDISGQCVNRFLQNCQNFQFPADCDVKLLRDIRTTTAEQVLEDHDCTSMSEHVYRHGNPEMCKLYFDHIRVCFELQDGVTATLASCSIFDNMAAVQAEAERLKKEMQSKGCESTVTITGYQAIASIITGPAACTEDKPLGGPTETPWAKITITKDACTYDYTPCSTLIGGGCQSFQSGEDGWCSAGPGITPQRACCKPRHQQQYQLINGQYYITTVVAGYFWEKC